MFKSVFYKIPLILILILFIFSERNSLATDGTQDPGGYKRSYTMMEHENYTGGDEIYVDEDLMTIELDLNLTAFGQFIHTLDQDFEDVDQKKRKEYLQRKFEAFRTLFCVHELLDQIFSGLNLREMVSFSGTCKLTNGAFWNFFNQVPLPLLKGTNKTILRACQIVDDNKDHTNVGKLLLEHLVLNLLNLRQIQHFHWMTQHGDWMHSVYDEFHRDVGVVDANDLDRWDSICYLMITLADIYAERVCDHVKAWPLYTATYRISKKLDELEADRLDYNNVEYMNSIYFSSAYGLAKLCVQFKDKDGASNCFRVLISAISRDSDRMEVVRPPKVNDWSLSETQMVNNPRTAFKDRIISAIYGKDRKIVSKGCEDDVVQNYIDSEQYRKRKKSAQKCVNCIPEMVGKFVLNEQYDQLFLCFDALAQAKYEFTLTDYYSAIAANVKTNDHLNLTSNLDSFFKLKDKQTVLPEGFLERLGELFNTGCPEDAKHYWDQCYHKAEHDAIRARFLGPSYDDGLRELRAFLPPYDRQMAEKMTLPIAIIQG